MKATIIILIFLVQETNAQSKANESLKSKDDVIARIAKLCTKENSEREKLINVLTVFKSQLVSLRENHNRDSIRREILFLKKELDKTIKTEFGDEVFKRFIRVTRPQCPPPIRIKTPIIPNRTTRAKRTKASTGSFENK